MAFSDMFTGHKGRALGGGGYDLTKKQYRRSVLAPAYATAGFLESPEFQQWANPEQVAQTQGVQSIYGGMQTAQRQAANQASRFGLGRGAATQLQMDTRRQAMNSISEALLASRMLGLDRRLEGSSMLLDAITEGQLAAQIRSASRRQRPTLLSQWASPSGVSSAGQAATGAGGLISALKTGGV